MTTVEKLFVQIFERKNSIIEQVKQQTDLYTQHLASKLLIDGITPPSWLWNPSQSSNPKELNKDELISEILLPRAWPSTCYPNSRYSICNRTVVTSDNGELSNGAFVDTYASSKDLCAGEGPSSEAVYRDNNNEDVLNSIPELEVSISLPQDVTLTRNESTLDAPDQSLAKIQRSKSRQKALELRSSTKGKAKSQSCTKYNYGVTSIGIDFSPCVSDHVIESNRFPDPSMLVSGSNGLPDERNCAKQDHLVDNYAGRVTRSRRCSMKLNRASDNCKADSYPDIAENVKSSEKKRHAVASTGIDMPMLPFEQENLFIKSPKISEPCMISTGNYAFRESSKGDHQNLEKGVDVYNGGIIKSRSSVKHQKCVHDSYEVNNSSDIAKKNSDGQAYSITGVLNQLVTVVNSSDVTDESHDVFNTKIEGNSHRKKEMTGIYSGRLSRSESSIQQRAITSETLQVDASTCPAQVDAQTSRERMEKLVDTKKHLELIQPSIELGNRSSNPQCHSGNEVITDLAKISSLACARGSETMSAALQKSSCENQDIQNASHDNVILTGPRKCDADIQAGDAEADSSKSSIPKSHLSETNRRVGSECLVAKLPSDCFMLMEPKQLDFDNMEECNLNVNSNCASEDEDLDIANKEIGCTPLDCFPLKDKVLSSNRIIFSEKQSTLDPDIYRKLNGHSSCPVEFTIQEPGRSKIYASDIEMDASKSRLDDPKVLQCFRNSNILPEEDNTLANRFSNSDAKHHHMMLCPRERSDSFIEPYIEVGVSGCKRQDEGMATSCASKSKNLVTPCTTGSTSGTTGDYQKCLAKEVANEDPTGDDQKCLAKGVANEDPTGDYQKFLANGVANEEPSGDYQKCLAKGVANEDPIEDYQKCLSKEVGNEDPTRGQYYIQGATCGDENSSLLKSMENQIAMCSSLLEKKFSSAKVNSWPQVKRRKLEDQRANCFSVSRNSQMPTLSRKLEDQQVNCFSAYRNSQMPRLSDIKMTPGSIDLHHIEGQAKAVFTEGSYGDNINSELCPTIDSHVPEGADLCLVTSHGYMDEEIGSGDPSGSTSIEETGKEVPAGPTFDTVKCSNEQDFQSALKTESNSGFVNNERISCTGSLVLKGNSHMVEDGLFPRSLVHSSHDEVESTDIDDTNPVFEGFVIDPSVADGELDIAGVEINFEALDLPRTTIERASILEQICRSASMQKPLSHLSSALESQRSHTLYQSLPKGLLEHMDFRSTSFLSEDIDKQFRASTSCAEEGISYSDCLGNSGAKYRWKSRSPYASPVGKLWERTSSHSGSSEKQLSSNPELTCFPIEEDTISEENENVGKLAEEVQDINSLVEKNLNTYSDCLGYSGAKYRWKSGSPYASPVGKLQERTSSHSGSSEKQLSSNPELTCFPIEEDPTISEEYENVDKLADEVQDINSLVGNSHAERQPLCDITEACMNPHASVSAAEEVKAGGRMDSAKSDAGFNGTHNKSKRKLPSHCRNISVGKENRTLLISATGNKKEKPSRKNGSRKPILSATTSLRRSEQRLSENGYNRHNNIVSNVTSFIPLVQQKQAATVCTGKKDIKVKALEAAEAAKRLEEKKEIERRKRKEAVKLERARLEQENLRQLEINKQKKEEERKKKDAEVLARKRLRAEEEKNEKEKKRKRIEEVRRQHNEQEEKLRGKKVEIEKKCSAAEEKTITMKENDDKLNICHMEKERADDKASCKPVSIPRKAEVSKNDNSGATVPLESLDNSVDQSQHEKVKHANLDKHGKDQNFTAKETKLKSYEISPYKCSDDEDEDEDDEPIQKFIPSWARKSCVAQVLPLQQEIDPDLIFPPESFCSMDEVLLPRKLQQKHAAV